MPDHSLRDCRVLVVEDEYMLADELQFELEDAGARVIGPVGSVAGALDLIGSEAQLDGAILDVNLGGDMVFPVADLLLGRGVPIVFTTGYDQSAIPSRYSEVVRCEKPINIRLITAALGRAVHA